MQSGLERDVLDGTAERRIESQHPHSLRLERGLRAFLPRLQVGQPDRAVRSAVSLFRAIPEPYYTYRMNVELDSSQEREIEALARATGRSVAEVLRELVDNALRRESGQPSAEEHDTVVGATRE